MKGLAMLNSRRPWGSLQSLAVALLLLMTFPALAETPSGMSGKTEWQSDLPSGLAEAKKQDKLVLLRFTAKWCAPCRVMDASVWPDQKVRRALSRDFLPVLLDIDDAAAVKVARKHGVQAVPTLLVLNGNGEEVSRGSFMSTKKLLAFLEQARDGGEVSMTSTRTDGL